MEKQTEQDNRYVCALSSWVLLSYIRRFTFYLCVCVLVEIVLSRLTQTMALCEIEFEENVIY